MDNQPKNKETTGAPKALAGLAAIIGAAVAISSPITTAFEGERLHPYFDPAHISTVCDGETQVAMRDYTHAECARMLQEHQAQVYAPKVLACAPALGSTPKKFALAASIDAAYNAGTAAYCRSPMVKAFNAGRWKAGCSAFKSWYITARVNGRPKVLGGLVKRRKAESQLCMRSFT